MPVEIAPGEALGFLQSAVEAIAARDGRALVALDGMAAGGKTTLAGRLARAVDGCTLVHMDDFFLPQEKRTRAHYERTLAWADVARVRDEVLAPLRRGEDAVYRPYVHHPEPRFLPPVRIAKDARVVIVEGAYALNPALFPFYSLRVLMCVSPETQRARILERNGQALLSRFLSEWIPMENRHIDAHALLGRADMIIRVP